MKLTKRQDNRRKAKDLEEMHSSVQDALLSEIEALNREMRALRLTHREEIEALEKRIRVLQDRLNLLIGFEKKKEDYLATGVKK